MAWLRIANGAESIRNGSFQTKSGVLIEYEYRDRGAKTTIAFVNGWATTHAFEWTKQRNIDSNLLFHNSRGTGKSTINNESYLKASAQDIAELMKYLGITGAHFVGHSMGGLVLAQFYSEYSKEIDFHSLSFVCTPCGNPLDTFPYKSLLPRNLSFLLGSFEDGLVGFGAKIACDAVLLRAGVRLALRQAGFKIDEGEFAELYKNLLTNRTGVRMALEAMIETGDEIASKLGAVTCPVQIFTGEGDPFVSSEAHLKLLRLMPHATHRRYDATHGLMYEVAASFNRDLVSEIERIESERLATRDSIRPGR